VQFLWYLPVTPVIQEAGKGKIAVVLHRPRVSENIGSVARAMLNMGIDELLVVEPDNFDMEKAAKTATHSAREILEKIQIHGSLRNALAPFHYVVGTTARLGGQRVVESPRNMAAKVAAICRENRVALVFGPEDRGLSNEDLSLCHALINIPTAGFSSLNLAQAVMVVCYELFTAESRVEKQHIPRLATLNELEIMYDDLSKVLFEIGYVNPENPDFWLNHIRHFLSRMKLEAKEASMVKGVIRHIFQYGKEKYNRGVCAGKKKS